MYLPGDVQLCTWQIGLIYRIWALFDESQYDWTLKTAMYVPGYSIWVMQIVLGETCKHMNCLSKTLSNNHDMLSRSAGWKQLQEGAGRN